MKKIFRVIGLIAKYASLVTALINVLKVAQEEIKRIHPDVDEPEKVLDESEENQA